MVDDELTPIWKALSDPRRREILDLLKMKPRTTGELSASFDDVSRYAVMKHLTVLSEAGLIVVRRKGKERWNHLNAVPLQQIYERWIKSYEAQWAQSLINLKSLAEQENIMSNLTPTIYEIEQEIVINQPREKVFQSILDMNGWWGHRFARFPDSLRFEAHVGGRFWEVVSEDDESDGVLWGMVTRIKKNELLKISGAIGMPSVSNGSFEIRLEEQAGNTLVKLSHHFMGGIGVDESWQVGFSKGWTEHLNDLKALAETGKRVELPTVE